MEITFDRAKDSGNRLKHGISLDAAADLEWSMLLAKEDDRRVYGEIRMIGYAPIGERIYCVVFTDRGQNRRIISLRKANAKEVKQYASQV